MSDLIAIAYDDLDAAESAMSTIDRLRKEHVVELEDAVLVEQREDGGIKLHQTHPMALTGAAGGALWGGLIGLIFMVPLLGMLIGGAAGAAGGAMTDYGIDDDFMREIGERIRPGGAAVFVLLHKTTVDKLIPALSEHGGHVLQTSLSDEVEQRLREATSGARFGES